MVVNKNYIVLFIIGLVFSTGVILFDQFSKIDPQESLNKSFDEIENAFLRDSGLLVSKFLVSGDLSPEVEDSPFDIVVKSQSDTTLYYWNKKSAKRPIDYTTHWKKEFLAGDKKIIFNLDLFNGKKLDLADVVKDKFLPQYEYIYNPKGKVLLPFEGNPVHMSISSPYIRSQWHNYLVVLWLISLLFIGRFIAYLYKDSIGFQDNLLSWMIYSAVTVGIAIIAGYLATVYLFGSHPLLKSSSGDIKPINLLTFTSLLLYIYLFVDGINKRVVLNWWLNRGTLTRYLLGSILANSLMFFVIFQAEKFIMSGDIVVNIEEVLNLEFRTLYFILLLMGYCIVYYYLSALVYRYNDDQPSKVWQRMLGYTLGLVFAASLYIWLGIETPIIPVVLFLIAYFLIHDLYEEFDARNLTYVLMNVILFAAFLSVVIFYSALRKDKILRKADMQEVFTFLTDDDKGKAVSIRDSLIQSNLIPSVASLSYPLPMDRVELMDYIKDIIRKGDTTQLYSLTGLECYDQSGNSLFFNHISNFQSNNATILNSQKVADNIYHLPLRSLTTIFFQIENLDFPNSPINMIIKLSKAGERKNPNLEDKNYLVYKKDNLIYSFSNDFLDINKIDPESLTEDIDIGEMSYVVYTPDVDYKIIDYHEVAGLIKPISFFSMIFIICGLLIVILTLFNTKFKFLPQELDFKFYNQSSLRSKIQLSVILLIIFSFLVIGVITTVYFKNIVTSNDRSKFKSELKTIINDVENKLTETLDSEAASNIIAKEFSELENIYDRRFAYYNQEGRRIIKSEGFEDAYNLLPYSILKSLENGVAKSSLKSVSQQIGEDQVLIPIYLTDRPLGYLSMNYTSEKNISNGIYNHLGNLLNVYIFLFFLAGAISIFIANSITEPLAKLREGVKRFKLGRTNEPLKYESSDELGVLIKEYNNMTMQLERSAQMLAKTERDMAWREMAKQVAHEIKNPLTPMKLHIQHLQNTVKSSPERAMEMIGKVSSTLIEQINNLSNIASEFSNYATLPKADNNKTDLNEVVEHVHDLFRERDDMDIHMNEPLDDLLVFADRNHLVRILVNIIKNAIQSIPQDRRGLIKIELTKVEDYAKLIITDNGVGIPDTMKDKIFTPNFTTKSSGTGLGLAICVNMLDTMNGKIYFDSTEGKGTQFFIEIPIMRSSDSDSDGEIFLED